jgi:hypothetical protein
MPNCMRTCRLRSFLQILGSAVSAFQVLAAALSATFKTRAALHLENLTLPHQLGVLQRSVKRPRLTSSDRLLWAWLCEIWTDWRSALVIVKPKTVISWLSVARTESAVWSDVTLRRAAPTSVPRRPSGLTAGTDFHRHPRKRLGQIPATVSFGSHPSARSAARARVR